MLGTDVVVIQPARLVDSELDDLLRARRQADFTQNRPVTAADDELDGRAHLVELDAEVRQHLRRHAVALADEAQQQVLGTDVVMVETLGLFLGQREDTARTLGEFVEPVSHSSAPALNANSA
jgi:hypothetical protein